MNVGWIGLGKLGLPCALALAHKAGHNVFGYDVSDWASKVVAGDLPPHKEKGIEELLYEPKNNESEFLIVNSISEVVQNSDVIFVAVQTPHDPRYGGEAPVAEEPVDFEVQYLVNAVREACKAAKRQEKNITLVVISTVLPGTSNDHLRPLLNEYVTFVYSPLFIAMSQTIPDYVNPEFVLMGADKEEYTKPVQEVYRALHARPFQIMSVESAELTKVAYNCFISMKVVFGNMMMELCHKTGADSDQVIDALSNATDRIISPAYMRGGMGDSGGCHPRDNQAMSWLAKKLDLSVDLMGYVSKAREAQSEWLAELVEHYHRLSRLPVVLMGKAYKKNVALTNGSAGILLWYQLREKGIPSYHEDPFTEEDYDFNFDSAKLFVMTMNHDTYRGVQFPKGSIVLDPWAFIPDQEGVTVIRIGRKS